jgi:hypothetical protein
MIRELKYVFYLIVIFLFIFFTSKYYFSDENQKNSYRSFQSLNIKIENYTSNIILLKNNTEHIIEYVDNKKNKNEKKYYFWNLLTPND